MTDQEKKFVELYEQSFDATSSAKIAFGISDEDIAFIKGSQLIKSRIGKVIEKKLIKQINERKIKVDLYEISKRAKRASDRIKCLELLGKSLGMFADKIPENSFTWNTLIIEAHKVRKELAKSNGERLSAATDNRPSNRVTAQIPE